MLLFKLVLYMKYEIVLNFKRRRDSINFVLDAKSIDNVREKIANMPRLAKLCKKADLKILECTTEKAIQIKKNNEKKREQLLREMNKPFFNWKFKK